MELFSSRTFSSLGTESYTNIGDLIRLLNYEEGYTQVLNSLGGKIGELGNRYNLIKEGIYYSKVSSDIIIIKINY